ncbi:MAG: hydrolase [Symbiobacteriaceae bacterium]|jgi:8-oxo-dGTP pyrophosphatase MutT (NUDIX family)|nr:hydrolase [Symbiobacteriaceae bacterium]
MDNRFLFAFGPHAERPGRLAIVRVGGHREPGETAWECAAREALEETGLSITPLPVRETLLWSRAKGELEPLPALSELLPSAGPRPLLVLPRADQPGAPVNVMYLVQAQGVPAPLDVRGLLLLTPAEILTLNRRPTTLDEFLAAGGQAFTHEAFPAEWILEPGLQFQLLARLLEAGQPDVTALATVREKR